jgi:purine nucleoside permease
MYERAAETGDHFGEFHLWVERLPLPERIALPQGRRELRHNPATGVLGIVTGVGTARAAASVMALGMDPRFDLTSAYWLVAGIAGVNPYEASVGSAAWVERVVDADLAFEIDAREIPADWPTGYLPLGRSRPYEMPVAAGDSADVLYHLAPGLVAWAYRLTAGMMLADTPALQAARAPYAGFPAAQAPPRVLRGDEVSGSTFWHGALLNRRAIDWLGYWTEGRGRFVMTAMEETGSLQSLAFLAQAGRVDWRRIMVLRTGSNFTMPPPGTSAADGLAADAASPSRYAGYRPALDAAYFVGRKVIDEITANWGVWADVIPDGRE